MRDARLIASAAEVRVTIIGLLHPGEMGAAVGACLTGAGHTVLWDPAGRSAATAARARRAGLDEAGLAAIQARSDVIFSICPPHAARDVARSVPGFMGVYVDANAVSPATARDVADTVERSGATYVDGGIIGSPPMEFGTTRLYLSSPGAPDVARLFDGTALDARVLESPPMAASALKMSYASWTKGSAALLLASRALGRATGVEDALLGEWGLSQPGLAARSRAAADSAASKGWRWVAEMEEIAASMGAQDLPDGFGLAAAEIYRRRL